jgi:hypothetical protein
MLADARPRPRTRVANPVHLDKKTSRIFPPGYTATGPRTVIAVQFCKRCTTIQSFVQRKVKAQKMSTLIEHCPRQVLSRGRPESTLNCISLHKLELGSNKTQRLTASSGALKGTRRILGAKKSGRWGFRPLWAWGDGGALISGPDGAGGRSTEPRTHRHSAFAHPSRR